jgi:MoaA/NifB/PqqE/SkfB family radical SAM enzyme
MIQEHFDLLQRLVDQDIAGGIEIHYNTNGTQFPEHAESIWKHFKVVEISFSIYDIEKRFEYQRTNAVWSEVEANIKKFKLMRDRHLNVQLQVCSTVNVFNVYYLESLANWIDTQDFDFIYWNIMHESYYFSINTLPAGIKEQIRRRLQSAKVREYHLREFEKIIRFMMNGSCLDGTVLTTKIADLDHKRQQNLFAVEPELAQMLQYNGP